MFVFVLRRILVSLPIMLAASFVVFGLVTISGDPLAFIRESQAPNKEQRIAQLRSNLHLDESYIQRYWTWLTGLIHGDFGKNIKGQDVGPLLSKALESTLRLVLLSVVLTVIVGIAVGVLSAVRQYSAFDYASTFSAFLFFALPVFWLAVLLKEFGAIKLNDFLEQPGLSATVIVLLAIATGLFWASFAGGSWTRRILAGAGGFLGTLGVLFALRATDWLENPGFSPLVLALLGLVSAFVAISVFGELTDRRFVVPCVLSALGALALTWVFHDWIADPSWSELFFFTIISLGLAAALGAAFGGTQRRAAVSASLLTSFLTGCFIILDRILSAWTPGRTIATVGPNTPNFEGTFWARMVDYAGHQVLPTIALALIGFATYSRFTRASMLDTMKSDYVRTARAKGLRPAQVIFRHAFRTALIPVVTVITLGFARDHRGRRDHRERVRVERHGHAVRQGPPGRRPVSGDGVRRRGRDLDRAGEHDRRHPVRLHGPEDPSCLSRCTTSPRRRWRGRRSSPSSSVAPAPNRAVTPASRCTSGSSPSRPAPSARWW